MSSEYDGIFSRLTFQCSEGHIWTTSAGTVRSGSWCPVCGGKYKKAIEKMRALAKSKGGYCLSNNYVNQDTPLKWQCSEGHIWHSKPRNIKKHWCLECYNQRRGSHTRASIEEMQRLAAERNGRCLSAEYRNTRIKLLWQCSEGHTWKTTPDNIKKGHWCPECGSIRTKLSQKTLRLDIFIKLAEEKGGKCLSTKYINLKLS